MYGEKSTGLRAHPNRDTLRRLGMCPDRIDHSAGFVPLNGTRGPNGGPLCRWCGKEASPPRRSYCSDLCQHEHLLRTSPTYARQRVAERDGGICALCRRDTNALSEIYRWAKTHYDDLFSCLSALKAWGAPWFERRVYGHFFHEDLARLVGVTRLGVAWEMDHIIPVIEGGGGCGLENLRTLCIPCHRSVTRNLRRKLSASKRLEAEAEAEPDALPILWQ